MGQILASRVISVTAVLRANLNQEANGSDGMLKNVHWKAEESMTKAEEFQVEVQQSALEARRQCPS